jgi:cytochrome b
MLRKGVTYTRLAEMCEGAGWSQKLGYLRQIASGHNRPNIMKWPGGAVMIYRYPYKRKLPRKKRPRRRS